jgi:hypothetical protein
MRLGIAFGPPVCASAEEIGIPAKLLNRCERDRIDPVLDCDDTSGPELGDRMSERPKLPSSFAGKCRSELAKGPHYSITFDRRSSVVAAKLKCQH